MSVQINTTIARHNAHQLPQVLELAKSLGADALHTFLLVPVGCGVDIAAEQMVPPEEYEEMLNWFYDQSLEGGIEMKATCAPHYFRVVRQRRVAGTAKRRSPGCAACRCRKHRRSRHRPHRNDDAGFHRNRTETAMALGTGHPGEPSFRHECHDQGMPGRNRRLFHLASRRSLSLRIFAGAGRRSETTGVRRHLGKFGGVSSTARCQNLKGKCGCCEFRNICMGCRARAFAATGNYLDEEPFCVYQPRATSVKERPRSVEVAR